MTEKSWQIAEQVPDDFVGQFPEHSDLICRLLYNRGLKTQEQIDEFFDADYSAHLSDPYLFNDMDKAIRRILQAVGTKERIVIYGDYDADGVCSSIVLYSALLALGVKAEVYIPDRFEEGYGLNKKALSEITRDGKGGLIISVDCGITNVEEVEYAKERKMDVIIIDHHIAPPNPPKAYAIVNPKVEGEEYPFKFFCAAGVVFKVIFALLKSDYAKKMGIKEGSEKWLLDVVAIASVADMVPLIGENRTLVKYGLIVINKTQRTGLKALLNLRPARSFSGSPMDGEITSETIAFMIAPRINATSRMAHATVSFELLISADEDEADRLARQVEGLNNDRRKIVDQILKDAAAEIENDNKTRNGLPSIIFIGRDEWPVGVAGLVSNRLTERYGRPSFVYGRSNNHIKGSCRGIGGFNVVVAMRHCQEKENDLFLDFGGHSAAGGFAIARDKIDRFREYLIEFGDKILADNALNPILAIEAEILPDDINWSLFDYLLRFEPYGEGNKKPIFIMKDMIIASFKAVGKKEDHLKMKLKSTLESGAIKFFDCIGFGLSDRMINDKAGDKVDIVFELEANEWNGTRELQLKLKDIRKSNE